MIWSETGDSLKVGLSDCLNMSLSCIDLALGVNYDFKLEFD